MATPSLTLRLCPVGCLCAGRLRQPAAPVKRQEASPLTIPSQTVENWTLYATTRRPMVRCRTDATVRIT